MIKSQTIKIAMYIINILVIIVIAYFIFSYFVKNDKIEILNHELKITKDDYNQIIAEKNANIISFKNLNKHLGDKYDSIKDVLSNIEKPEIITEYKTKIIYDTIRERHDSVIYVGDTKQYFFNINREFLKMNGFVDTLGININNITIPNEMTFIYSNNASKVTVINSNPNIKVDKLESYIPIQKDKWYDKWYIYAGTGLFAGVLISN